MGSQRISPWPARPLAFEDVQNAKPTVAEIASGLSSNIALLEGYVTGGEDVGQGPNLAPVNPMGDRGHDHSGGVHGRALFRSVATLHLGEYGGAFSSDLARQLSNGAHFTTGSKPGGTTDKIRTGDPLAIWVPPCDKTFGAYVNLAVAGLLWIEATTLGASDTFDMQVTTDHGDGGNRAVDFSISSPNSTGMREFRSGNLLTVRPGQFNPLNFIYSVVRAGGGASRGIEGGVIELELGVFES